MSDTVRNVFLAMALALSTTIFVATVVSGCSGADDPPLIFAAASLVDVMEEIADAYEQETSETVWFSFGGSKLIANQIIAGADADAVIVAGTSPIALLVEDGIVEVGSETQIFTNRLVVVSRADNQAGMVEPDELVGVGKIAFPDPATAPAGEYFESAMRELGIWDQLQDQLVPTLDVRAALSAASTGNVEYAFVYETDAISTDDVEIVAVWEGLSDSTLPRYYAASIIGNDRADRFIEFLVSPNAMSILKSHGFSR